MNEITPSLTLVTPAYNHARYVAQTIQSVLGQSFKNFEYIVVNDGSTDDTSTIVKKIEGKFAFFEQANAGQSATLNKYWSNSNSKYLSYLSADDIILPELVAKSLEILESNADVVCVFPNSDIIDSKSKIVQRSVTRPFSIVDLVVSQECYIGPGAIFRKSAFDQVGGWRNDLRIGPDREFWMRLSKLGRFHMITESLAQYRVHADSYSFKEISHDQSAEFIRVLDGYFEKDASAEVLSRRNEAYANAWFLVARNAFKRGDWRDGLQYLAKARRLDLNSVNLKRLAFLAGHVLLKPWLGPIINWFK